MLRSPEREPFATAVREALADPPAGIDAWFLQYCGELGDAGGLETYVRAKRQLVALGGGVAGKVVVDAGSGFGMVANLVASWGARRVYGVDLHQPKVDYHRRILRRHFAGLDHVHPVCADASRLPLRRGSVDMVLSIEAISHYYDAAAFLDECARIVRPGGHVLISDGNNGANPRIRAHTEELWERLENGPAGRLRDTDVPEPMVERRLRILRERFPDLDAARARDLAGCTSGMVRADIERVVEEHLRGGPQPAARYRRGTCPREPFMGHWIERLFDPRDLARDLARRGFAARALPHYGGARNDLVLTANRVLRTVPSFRFARGYRIVARRS